MPYPNLTFAAMLESATRQELEQFVSLLQGYLSTQHTETGAHGAITATSVAATGAVSGSTGTFTGAVTAASATTPVVLAADTVLGPGIAMRNGTAAKWRWAALGGATRTLTLKDELQVSDTSALEIQATNIGVTVDYSLLPHSASTLWYLGQNATGQRWTQVNALTVTTNLVTTNLLNLQGSLIPAQLTASVNDYAISTAARVKLTANAAWNITGIVAGADGQVLWIWNNSAFVITLKSNDAGSLAANRLIAATTGDYAIRANGSALLEYDATTGFWIVLGA